MLGMPFLIGYTWPQPSQTILPFTMQVYREGRTSLYGAVYLLRAAFYARDATCLCPRARQGAFLAACLHLRGPATNYPLGDGFTARAVERRAGQSSFISCACTNSSLYSNGTVASSNSTNRSGKLLPVQLRTWHWRKLW